MDQEKEGGDSGVVRPNSEELSIDIPEEIITEILLRLPAKRIIQFCIMCKRWLSIIKSPAFVLKNMILNHGRKSTKSVIAIWRHVNASKYSMSLYYEDAPDTPIDIDFPFLDDNEKKKKPLHVVAVSYGLVCIGFSQLICDIVICNPLTRQFYEIPSTVNLGEDGDTAVGFMFDPISNDYKLIKLLRAYDSNDVLLEEVAWIYTMRTGYWRKINIMSPIGNDFSLEWPYPVAVIGSVCHWTCYHFQSKVRAVLTFNMSDESFGLISAPQDFRSLDSNTLTRFQPGQLNDELAYFGIDISGVFTVWTPDADSAGWSMKISVELIPKIATTCKDEVEEEELESGILSLVGRRRDQEVVIQSSLFNHLFLYDLVCGEITSLPFEMDHCYYFKVDRYTESLFPVIQNEGNEEF